MNTNDAGKVPNLLKNKMQSDISEPVTEPVENNTPDIQEENTVSESSMQEIYEKEYADSQQDEPQNDDTETILSALEDSLPQEDNEITPQNPQDGDDNSNNGITDDNDDDVLDFTSAAASNENGEYDQNDQEAIDFSNSIAYENTEETFVPQDYNPEDSESDVVAEIDDESQPPQETDDQAAYPSSQPPADEPDQPYVPNKISAAAAMGKMKPLKLNRQLILFIILGFCCLSVLFVTFILPAFQTKKAQAEVAKKSAEKTEFVDYSLYANRRNENQEMPNEQNFYDDVEIPEPYTYYDNNIPEPEFHSPPPSNNNVMTSSSSERPDTRNDRLQGKSISGIKNLSSSRNNYAPPAPQNDQPANNPYAQFGLPANRDDYLKSVLSASGQGANNNSYTAQNNQNGKLDFVNQGRENAGSGQWLPFNAVWQGTIFEATLTSEINTDLPGECTAWITKNVYNSLDGRFLLIPQNSRLLGSYNSVINYAQSRVQVGWHTLIRPDGYMVNLGNMQAADLKGASGLTGFVNDHPFAYLKALGLITALNVVNAEFDQGIAGAAESENTYVQNILADSRDMTNRLSTKIIDRALDIQPTIIISNGTKLNIVVNQNLVLPPLAPYGVNQQYQRGK